MCPEALSSSWASLRLPSRASHRHRGPRKTEGTEAQDHQGECGWETGTRPNSLEGQGRKQGTESGEKLAGRNRGAQAGVREDGGETGETGSVAPAHPYMCLFCTAYYTLLGSDEQNALLKAISP